MKTNEEMRIELAEVIADNIAKDRAIERLRAYNTDWYNTATFQRDKVRSAYREMKLLTVLAFLSGVFIGIMF